MNNRHSESMHSAIDGLFYAPANFEMLVSLINDTLKSRHNIALTPNTSTCIKSNLLDIMKFVYDHRSELQMKQPISLSEYNLVMNKQVLDISIEKLPKVIQQNLSCRPLQSDHIGKNIDNAFKKLQNLGGMSKSFFPLFLA